ncbi:hypothetical protein Ancab_029535 [Ancistrocladus abbreviatus]
MAQEVEIQILSKPELSMGSPAGVTGSGSLISATTASDVIKVQKQHAPGNITPPAKLFRYIISVE